MLETGGLQGFVAAILVCRLVRDPVLVEQDEEWLNQLPNILFFSGLHECTYMHTPQSDTYTYVLPTSISFPLETGSLCSPC